ncbi:hypothetical protein AX15_001141 [Amanita polypyramis BW_CC]|nr:hypothetical protein AX15_001141 [Amanita polypyramis BW_CC]
MHNDPDGASARRTRHRSVDVRQANRLSGFFNHLIRRDHVSAPRADPQPASRTPDSTSRPSSPLPSRSTTPPPTLPPPSLHELGLSLSEITADISPPHFSNPPTSGAFLAPHYLLLCHTQGLDVLPIVSPPAPQPYALIRRVSFKSVAVMEHRGVLVAIAGRRDGVRVYALEEIKKAIEWRMDVEVRRERERRRQENNKQLAAVNGDSTLTRSSGEKVRRASLSTPPSGNPMARSPISRKASTPLPFTSDRSSMIPLTPRPPVPRSPTRRPRTPRTHPPHPFGQPPPYASAEISEVPQDPMGVHACSSSLSTVLTSVSPRPSTSSGGRIIKTNWDDSSDDEAINVVAAGATGSQALDERTSATLNAAANNADSSLPSVISHAPSTTPSGRRNRPTNLDLSLARPDALSLPPSSSQLANSSANESRTVIGDGDMDDDDDDTEGRISLAQALLESRLPDLPPMGTRRPQQPILISSSSAAASGDEEPASPRTSEGHPPSATSRSIISRSRGRRRRWSIIISSSFTDAGDGSEPMPGPLTNALPSRDSDIPRVTLFRSATSRHTGLRPSTAPGNTLVSVSGPAQTADSNSSIHTSHSSRSSRFFSRILSNAFPSRRLEDYTHLSELENSKKTSAQHSLSHPPSPPKLEYVKLPGTKGSLLVKAVETPRKSFLAILCGDNGEKVELFAGTYRTALGLSRTFILPDSPRSLELQLQGDDLVEVFLVFSQNVFGLEPATVRVREVRIGRAERRAARRRAREMRSNDVTAGTESENVEEETNVNVNVSVTVGASVEHNGSGQPLSPALIPAEHPDMPRERQPSPEPVPSSGRTQADELAAVATAQAGPYTTFQQLTFAPKFPLASIADEYIIPPTYPDFVEYRDIYETDANPNPSPSEQAQFSPPGLPVPPPAPPSKWYYRDPKGVVRGPWKATLMQSWYKDGFLPFDLPVRREEDTTYTLLRDLRLQGVDPTHPFRPSPLPATSLTITSEARLEKPLLAPITLLAQPRHFGPPALFYSSRGGHSTAVVDARGRSVLKGRFVWSNDDSCDDSCGRMGDVKRLEAFDVMDQSVLVAVRQGGLEAVNLSDALLRPADESRTALPQFNPPISNINRRAPFVWKIGTPISFSPPSSVSLPMRSRPIKKQSTGPSKSATGKSEFLLGDSGPEYQEVLFLGRKDNEIYLCERNAGSFRILKLSPQTP